MRRAALLAVAACATLPRPALAGAPVTIAVSYFENSAGAAELDPLKKGFADMLISDLAAADDLIIVERARLEQVLGEIRLQKSPYVDKATAVQLGKGLGAAYLLTGAYLVRGGRLRVDVRVVDVESGVVVLTAKQEGAEADFFAIEQALAEELLGGLGAKLSLLQKKKIGVGGTKRFGAFRHWSRALDARDRGDAEAEKAALAAAVAADPEFQRASARIAELEKRVTALETSAGRILRPTTAGDHVHNARIAKAEGKYEEAARSLAAAAGLDPTKVEVWLLARELDAGKPVLAGARGIDRALRPVVASYLAGDAAALDKAVGDAKGRWRLQAAAFLLDVAAPKLPARSLRGWAMALHACDALLGAEPAPLRAAFVDFTPFLQRTHGVCDRPFDASGRRQVEVRALVVAENRDGRFATSPWWSVDLAVLEPVTGGLTVTIARDTGHPHWAETPAAPTPDHYLHARSQLNSAGQAKLDGAIADPNMLVVQHGVWSREPRDLDPIGIVALGDTIEIEPSDVECEKQADLLTGRVCHAALRVYKPDLPPGAYRVEVAYTDVDGVKAVARRRVWAFESAVLAERSPERNAQDPHAPVRRVHPVGPGFAERAGYTPKLEGPAAGKNAAAGAVALVTSYYRRAGYGKRDNYEVEALWYDVDFALSKGAPPTEGDDAAWMRYRDRVMARGYRAEAGSTGIQWLSLPALGAGTHWLCIAAQRVNGSRTAEAECVQLDVEK